MQTLIRLALSQGVILFALSFALALAGVLLHVSVVLALVHLGWS